MTHQRVDFISGCGSYGDPWEREIPMAQGLFSSQDVRFVHEEDATVAGPRVVAAGDVLLVSPGGMVCRGKGFRWEHRATYCSSLRGGRRADVLGPGWFLADLPFLAAEGQGGKPLRIGIVGGMASVLWFARDAHGGWTPEEDGAHVLEHDTVDRSFRFLHESGLVLEFHSFDAGLARQVRGRLKSLRGNEGAVARVTYSINDEVAAMTWREADGQTSALHYEYATGQPHPGTLRMTALLLNGVPVQRMIYNYANQGRVSARLQQIRREIHDGTEWKLVTKASLKYGGHGGEPRLRLMKLVSATGLVTYRIHEDAKGGVTAVNHEGAGPPPVFLT